MLIEILWSIKKLVSRFFTAVVAERLMVALNFIAKQQVTGEFDIRHFSDSPIILRE